MSRTKVLQWATGRTGQMSLAAVIDSEDLELVGVRVYDENKAGRDAGEIADRPPTGISTTASRDEALALDADVVLYMGRVEMDSAGCYGDVVDLLAAGRDVIATGSFFIDPLAFDPELGRAIQEACESGASTFLGVGIFPGFFGESIAPVLSRLSYDYGTVAVSEGLCYAGYPGTELMFGFMGYGQDPDNDTSKLKNPDLAAASFVGTASQIAKALGLEVRSMESYRETRVTDKDLQVSAGLIRAGTIGAMKLGLRADCGPVTVTVEHVTWMDPDVAPDWVRPEGYQIEFDGAPSFRCRLELGIKGEDHNDMGCLATAMHAVNAIPVVRAASPGLLDLATVPGFTGTRRSPAQQ